MKPKSLVEHSLPDQRRQERREGVGQDHDDPVVLLALHPRIVEHDREEQAEREGRRHREDGEHERPDEHGEEGPTDRLGGERPDEVVDADPDLPSRGEGLPICGGEGAVAVVRVDDARLRVRHGACGGIPHERGDVLVGRRAVAGLERAVVGIGGERHRHRRDRRLVGHELSEVQGGVPGKRRRAAARELGIRCRLERLVGAADLGGAVGSGHEEEEGAVLLEDRHGIGGRVLDALLVLDEQRVDGVVLRRHVSRAVVRERDVDAVQDHEDLEDEEEDQARRQVLGRQKARLQVDDVDREDAEGNDRCDDDAVLGQQDEDRIDGHRVDDAQAHDLDQPDLPPGACGFRPGLGASAAPCRGAVFGRARGRRGDRGASHLRLLSERGGIGVRRGEREPTPPHGVNRAWRRSSRPSGSTARQGRRRP